MGAWSACRPPYNSRDLPPRLALLQLYNRSLHVFRNRVSVLLVGTMRLFSRFAPLALLAPFALADPNGYYIDDDCDANQQTFIVNALNNAFSLVAFGQGTVTVPNNQGSNLLTWLFGTADTQDPVVLSVRATLNAIANLNTRRTAVDQLQRNDVRIYCTTKRIKIKVKDKGIRNYDPGKRAFEIGVRNGTNDG